MGNDILQSISFLSLDDKNSHALVNALSASHQVVGQKVQICRSPEADEEARLL